MKTFKQMRENVTSDDDYKAKKKALQDIQNDPKQAAIVGRDKLIQRKDKLDKERVSNWSNDKYKVEAIQESMGQKFYKLEGRDKALMRSELLLID